jgi:glycosyltransferase involved in cell wall biosynthesis
VIHHYYGGGNTGVHRFNSMLRRIFPEMRSTTMPPFELRDDDTVITDNHLACEIPSEIKTVVVHHGCARTHFDRDPSWRTQRAKHLVELQERMFSLPNRKYVAPSSWVGLQFHFVCPRGTDYSCSIIPHWVDPIGWKPRPGKPVIIGDWRDNNKGASAWRDLAKACPHWEFRNLCFSTEEGKAEQYGLASLYLCLSLSEGGAYSMCDAEAAGIPIVTTNVGNYREFADSAVIRWEDRDNVDLVAKVIGAKLEAGRVKPSFYDSYTFDDWRQRWAREVQ